MNPHAKKIRAAIKHIPGAWVRVYKDGTAWAGCHGEYVRWSVGGEGRDAVLRAIEGIGYRCELNGQPGTSGEHIIDVILPNEDELPNCVWRDAETPFAKNH